MPRAAELTRGAGVVPSRGLYQLRYRIHLLFILALACAVGRAQPLTEATFLEVRAVVAAELPTGITPTVTALVRLDGKERTPVKAPMDVAAGGSIAIWSLTPGTYEVQLELPGRNLRSGPILVEVQAGPNGLNWRVPGTVPVYMTPDVPIGSYAEVFVLDGGGMIPAPCVISGGRAVFGIAPGKHEVLLLTDHGYAFAAFEAMDGTDRAEVAAKLQPAGALAMQATTHGKPIPGAGLYVTCTFRTGLTHTFHGNAADNGRLHFACVPVGAWGFDVRVPVGRQRGTLAVKAAETAKLSVDFP